MVNNGQARLDIGPNDTHSSLFKSVYRNEFMKRVNE